MPGDGRHHALAGRPYGEQRTHDRVRPSDIQEIHVERSPEDQRGLPTCDAMLQARCVPGRHEVVEDHVTPYRGPAGDSPRGALGELPGQTYAPGMIDLAVSTITNTTLWAP